jgi:hypothetical protein
VNGPNPIEGRAGQALGFTDASDQSVRLDAFNSVLNQGSRPYTISAWIYPTDMSALIGSHYGAGIIKSIGNGGNGAQGDFYLSVASNGELVFTNWQGPGDQPGSRHYVDLGNPANTAITANQWYHVAGTWDGAANAMYINGAPQTFLSMNADGGYSASTYIGALISGAAHWQWTGGIDEVRLYGQALSASQINALYSGTLSSAGRSSFLGSLFDVLGRLFR